MVNIVFTGRFDPDAFTAFVHHRAARLGLTATLMEAAPARICVDVLGAPEMIDAFEMACSLGPLSCLVRDVLRDPA